MLRMLFRICGIAAVWSLVWGIAGAAVGIIITFFQPDTGHIPVNKIPLLVGVPSAAFGLCAGLLYGILAVALGLELRIGARGRLILGACVGGAAGVVFMRVLAHSYLTVLVATVLGMLLAAGFLEKINIS